LHQLHPFVVHFTIAFIVTGGLIEGLARLWGAEALARRAEPLLLLGLLSLVPALATGYLAANTVDVSAAAETLGAHERNGWIVFALLLVAQFWKALGGGLRSPGASRSYALLLLAIVALTIYGGWLGGYMVYGQGIGVR
jgi:uncharacterized membrane protein